MKKIIVCSMIMALTLIIGSAFADEMPIMRDTGSQMYFEAFPTHVIGAPIAKDFGVRGPITTDELIETGTALYNSEFNKPMLAEKSVEGAAAGGVVREDENTRIWDNLLAPTGPSLE